jgi:hypothetical protein
MPEKPEEKKSQISIDDYLKLKEKRAKSKLKLHFPMALKVIFAVPAVYFLFLMFYFLLHLRFLAEH